jgi:hypothetical protein
MDARFGPHHLLDDIARAVRRVVVDEEKAGWGGLGGLGEYGFRHLPHVISLVISRYDNKYFHSGPPEPSKPL